MPGCQLLPQGNLSRKERERLPLPCLGAQLICSRRPGSRAARSSRRGLHGALQRGSRHLESPLLQGQRASLDTAFSWPWQNHKRALGAQSQEWHRVTSAHPRGQSKRGGRAQRPGVRKKPTPRGRAPPKNMTKGTGSESGQRTGAVSGLGRH